DLAIRVAAPAHGDVALQGAAVLGAGRDVEHVRQRSAAAVEHDLDWRRLVDAAVVSELAARTGAPAPGLLGGRAPARVRQARVDGAEDDARGRGDLGGGRATSSGAVAELAVRVVPPAPHFAGAHRSRAGVCAAGCDRHHARDDEARTGLVGGTGDAHLTVVV